MNASELRIGNHILRIEFEETTVGLLASGEINLEEEYGFTGIPLTEEWLLKFGFVNEDDEIDFSQFTLNGFNVFGNGSDKQEPFTAEAFHKSIEIKYVHQLQNLYFALTGQELTYTPSPSPQR